MQQTKQQKRTRRHSRIRAKVIGTPTAPRLCVFKSNQHIYAQIIDDTKGKTIISANDSKEKKLKKLEKAFNVGKEIAKLAIEKKIKKVVFDRGGFKYHGRIKALAEGAREGGLQF
ncbi:MAG: 50S ribosomal protein L18 [bacterium]|nr:50S ribosomal protein L18 [bacterium]